MKLKVWLAVSTLMISTVVSLSICYSQNITIGPSNSPATSKSVQKNNPGPTSLGFAPVSKTDKADAAKNEEVVPPGAKVVAHVVWVKGSFFASAQNSDVKRPLKVSSNVYMNDTLITVSNSEAQVVFTDNSLMTFRPNSRLFISEYNYVPKGSKKEDTSTASYIMNLLEGGFRTITGYVAKEQPDNYQINTPVATIGVRGTEFSVVVADDSGKTYVKQYKGVPCVNAKNKRDKRDAVCMDDKKKYTEVQDPNSMPQYVGQQPGVFQVDVQVVPVVYNGSSPGFCGMQGCGKTGGGGGFCIQ